MEYLQLFLQPVKQQLYVFCAQRLRLVKPSAHASLASESSDQTSLRTFLEGDGDGC